VKRLIQFGFLACIAAAATARPDHDEKLSVPDRAARFRAGQYVWEPSGDSTGPLLLVINLTAQRAVLFRDGVPIAASTISTGGRGRETPLGKFTILEKQVMHRSRTYDDAPMPYMQRLTWKGVSMHAGNLPGYPASHGCIRLPATFARLLYGVTQIGTPVMIVDDEQLQKAAEYQRAVDEVSRKMAELRSEAERQLTQFARAKAAHEAALRQREAATSKYRPKLARD
jgi:hypothetical protein